jgi:hypothetical protein
VILDVTPFLAPFFWALLGVLVLTAATIAAVRR